VGLEIEGADKVREVARALKLHGDKELTRAVYRRLNRTVKPLGLAVKASLGSYLPTRYALELARTLKVSSRRRVTKNPALYLVGAGKPERDLASLNRGRLRHPLFGMRGHWFDQTVRRDWWTDPLMEASPLVRRELEAALDDAADELVRRID
jgi:hypothetical protein